MARPEQPDPERYNVWFDPTLPDLIALKVSDTTPALLEQLAREGIEVRNVAAQGVLHATREAFPERFNDDAQRSRKPPRPEDTPTVRTVHRGVDAGTPRRLQ